MVASSSSSSSIKYGTLVPNRVFVGGISSTTTEADLHKLTFLGHARSLGFSIEDCRALLDLYDNKDRASADVKKIASEHLDGIERKIGELSAMRDTLQHLVRHCHGDGRPDCPIIESLAGEAG